MTFQRRRHMPRTLSCLVAVTIGAAAVLSATPAHAVSGPPVIVVCGYSSSYPLLVAPADCSDLQTAIDTAHVNFNDTTFELMPGLYCPISLPYGINNVTLAGVGAAGIDMTSNPTITGPEAALASFTYSAADCGATVPAAQISMPSGHYSGVVNGSPITVRLQNLAVVGTPSGPADGVDVAAGGDIALRDVLIKNQTGVGFDYTAANSDTYEIDNSALVGNGIGERTTATNLTSNGSINETTVAGNTTGLQPVSGVLTLRNVTVSDNTGPGLDVSATNSQVEAYNTIVGDNGTDCAGSVIFGHWESGGSTSNDNNLTGAACGTGSTDIALTSSVAAATDNGGPTPSVSPPAQAVGAAKKSVCGFIGADQREASYTAGNACDIGAVNSTGTTTTSAVSSPPSIAFGTVKTGISSIVVVDLANNGGALFGVSGVQVTGTGYSLNQDLCSFHALVNSPGVSCEVQVTFAPIASGSASGTLTFATTFGSVQVPLSGTGGAAATLPGAPTITSALAGDQVVNLGWTAPATGANIATVTGWATRYSDDSGATWTTGPSSGPYVLSGSAIGLTNGVPYIFQVAAETSIGNGAWSASTAPLTPNVPKDSTALSAPVSVTIHYGAKRTLTTTLTDTATNSAMGSRTVSLERRFGSSGPFTPVGSTATNASGVADVSVTPTRTTEYHFVYAGSATTNTATSNVATVTVKHTVRASLAAKQVKHGHVATVYGTVLPASKGQQVVLRQLVKGHWKTAHVAATIKKQKLPDGTRTVGFVLHLTPKKPGKLKLRVSCAATASLAAGVSHPVSLKVTK